MMVLRRRVGEAIRIGDDVRIVVQEVRDGRVVRLGIEAPPDVAVHRLEIFELIQRENRQARDGALAWLSQRADEKQTEERV